jgi:hypothetical protein
VHSEYCVGAHVHTCVRERTPDVLVNRSNHMRDYCGSHLSIIALRTLLEFEDYAYVQFKLDNQHTSMTDTTFRQHYTPHTSTDAPVSGTPRLSGRLFGDGGRVGTEFHL